MTEFAKGFGDFSKKLEKMLKAQMKDAAFAARKALNDTAFGAREELWDEFKKRFNVRNKTLKSGLWVNKAQKGETMRVDIAFKHDWMKFQAFGGTKKPSDTKRGAKWPTLAIPTSRGAVKINASGRISGAGAARMLEYSKKHPRAKSRKRRVANPHAFVMKGVAHGHDVVARRDKADRKKLLFYFLLLPSLKIRKNWDFYGIVDKYFKRMFDKNFGKAMEWAKNHPKK